MTEGFKLPLTDSKEVNFPPGTFDEYNQMHSLCPKPQD